MRIRRSLFCCSLLIFLQIMIWVCAATRVLPPSPPPVYKEMEEAYKEMMKIGSTPPNCERKCYGCNPCEAIQVPTINGGFKLQYTNYFPEGWKCKCGPSLYTP